VTRRDQHGKARKASAAARVVAAIALLFAAGGASAEEPLAASKQAALIDDQIDWNRARLIAVQDAGRYKTLDSFVRESFQTMYGAEHLPGLSPLASAMEWLFRRDAYFDTPVIRVKDQGLRIDFSTHLVADRRERVLRTGHMTPQEFHSPLVMQRIAELEPRATMKTAIGRVRDAEFVADAFDRMVRIVPQPGVQRDARWFAPQELLGSVSPQVLAKIGVAPPTDAEPVANLTSEQALDVLLAWSGLRAAWLSGDASAVQQRLDRLAGLLPTLAPPDVYPTASQRSAEARYYRMGKFTAGWMLYFAGAIVGIWALITRWRIPWVLGLGLLIAAMAFHAYGVGLRWYILGRIPIANMFEAVVGSACLGVAVGLLLELIYRSRVFLLAANALGFLALVLAGFVIPGGGTLTTIMGILDDVMLRIHTLLIIWSYALIFLGAVIAVVYLAGFYARTWQRSAAALPAIPLAAGLLSGSRQRPIPPGATPGDERRCDTAPEWLKHIDRCHLIILNLVFVMLFVGTVLGAVWADYSWGRPWGWDPKEVFALNTWLVYAVLIHVRFFVVDKGLWTAWLSIAGCTMMAFNWCFVNFFIVGLHSYA
jgi:cytochrome c-type biogenesis protein CcsB